MKLNTRKKELFLIAGAVVLLALLGLGLYFFLPRDPNDINYQYTFADFPDSIVSEEASTRFIDTLNTSNEALREGRGDAYTAWVNIGNVKVGLSDFAGAESAYHKAVEVDSQRPLAYLNLGTLYKANIGDYAQSEYYYLRALERITVPYFSDYESVADLYVNYYNERNIDIENFMLQGAEKVDANSQLSYYVYLASYFRKQNNTEKQALYTEKILEIDPTYNLDSL